MARLSDEQHGGVDTTYRLTDVLRHASTVGAYFGKDLDGDNGLNIEGLAVHGDQLIIGLRGPSIDGRAFLVRTDIGPLFAKGDGAGAPSSTTIPVAVPEGTGIRDLTTLRTAACFCCWGPRRSKVCPTALRE